MLSTLQVTLTQQLESQNSTLRIPSFGVFLDNLDGNIFVFSLLLALGNPKVNFFSLDIEGAELQVLRSMPWHLLDIEVNKT